MMWYGQVGARFDKMFAAFDTMPGKIDSTMIRLLLSHKFKDKSGKTWGRQWGVYNVFADPTSGFRPDFFAKLTGIANQCKVRGISLGITLFDGNWISLDPFTTHYGTVKTTYGGVLHPLQKAYIDKVLQTLDAAGAQYFIQPINEQYYGAIQTTSFDESLAMKERHIAAKAVAPYPSNSFCQSVVDYVRAKKPGCKIIVWKDYSVTGADLRVIHSGVGVGSPAYICNEEKVGGAWGGDSTVAAYKQFLQKTEPNGLITILAFWEWVWSKGLFAPNQMAALK